MSSINSEILKASITADGALHGKVSTSNELSGTICIGAEKYDGSHTIEPKTTAQILHTAKTYIAEDVIVEPIPFHSFDNEHNGQTVTIG